MKRLKHSLRKLYFLICFEKIISCIFRGLFYGLVCDFILIFLSNVVYLENLFYYIVFVHIICLFISILHRLIFWVNIEDTAKCADMLGFDERFTTAYEILKNDDFNETKLLAVEDALSVGEKTDFGQLYKIKIEVRVLFFCSCLLLFNLFLFFIPTPFREGIERQRENQIRFEEARQIIEDAKTMVSDDEKKKALDRLEKYFYFERKPKTGIEKIEDTEIYIKNISDLEKMDFKNLTEQLRKNKLLEDLADFADNYNSEDDLEKNIQAFNEITEKLSDEEIAEAAGILKNITTENEELKKSLEEAGKELEKYSRSKTDTKSVENKNRQAIKELMKQAEEIKEIDEEDNKISEALFSAQNKLSKNRKNSNSSQSNKKETGYGSGHIENDNTGETDVLDKNYSNFQIGEKDNQSESDDKKRVYVNGRDGESKIYEQSVDEYKKSALKSLNENALSGEEKEVVKKYFSDIE